VTTGEPGERKRGINGGKDGGIGENKDGGTGGGIKKGTGERIDKRPLFKKKRGFTIPLFLRRLRFRPLSPRLRGAVLPVKVIKSKKGLINNKTKIRGNTKRVRPKYTNKVKYQNNI